MASFVAAVIEIVMAASLAAAVFAIIVGKPGGDTGAVVVATCAASLG